MGSFSQDALSDVFDSNLDMGYSEASEVSEVPDGSSAFLGNGTHGEACLFLEPSRKRNPQNVDFGAS